MHCFRHALGKQRMAVASLLFLLAGGILGPQLSNATCDPLCLPHRLAWAGIPMTNGTTRSFFWPEDDSDEIYLTGNGIRITLDLQDLPRNRWHEVELQVNLTGDRMKDISGREGGGAYRVKCPSLSIDEARSCEGRHCSALSLGTNRASRWAFDCEAAPCGCPEFADCPSATEQHCSTVQLSEFSLLLDRPQAVFWRPESLEEIRVMWGANFEHSFNLGVEEDLLFKWIKVEVDLVEEEGTSGDRSCTLKVPQLNVSRTCSTVPATGSEMMFDSPNPLLLGLGCDLPPREAPVVTKPVAARAGGTSWAWISFLVIAIIVCIGVAVFFVVRRRNQNH
ncbi:uncharacterized protein LOC119577246 [Penaeus monodon]|uniref:uncharacterized protein LOC119577246 n=1 Tax=Penaeus monodon TaxID=6687 RepID=UPI0018A71EDB|nr:uncharacterized protein LOC119577246 [Penaeus monodon]